MMRPVGALWADATEGGIPEVAAWESKWCNTCIRSEDRQCPLLGVLDAGYTPTETTPIECSAYIPKEDHVQEPVLPVLGNGEYTIITPAHLPVGRDDETLLPMVEPASDDALHR